MGGFYADLWGGVGSGLLVVAVVLWWVGGCFLVFLPFAASCGVGII